MCWRLIKEYSALLSIIVDVSLSLNVCKRWTYVKSKSRVTPLFDLICSSKEYGLSERLRLWFIHIDALTNWSGLTRVVMNPATLRFICFYFFSAKRQTLPDNLVLMAFQISAFKLRGEVRTFYQFVKIFKFEEIYNHWLSFISLQLNMKLWIWNKLDQYVVTLSMFTLTLN